MFGGLDCRACMIPSISSNAVVPSPCGSALYTVSNRPCASPTLLRHHLGCMPLFESPVHARAIRS